MDYLRLTSLLSFLASAPRVFSVQGCYMAAASLSISIPLLLWLFIVVQSSCLWLVLSGDYYLRLLVNSHSSSWSHWISSLTDAYHLNTHPSLINPCWFRWYCWLLFARMICDLFHSPFGNKYLFNIQLLFFSSRR